MKIIMAKMKYNYIIIITNVSSISPVGDKISIENKGYLRIYNRKSFKGLFKNRDFVRTRHCASIQ